MAEPHPMVLQLRFTRSEFMRAIRRVDDADARRRILPMNCISWTTRHRTDPSRGRSGFVPLRV